jgi:hypothetical protein
MTRKKAKHPAGICMVCGCTDAEGCDEGCGWANAKRTICTACAELPDLERQAKRFNAAMELRQRLDLAQDEAEELLRRLEVVLA